jgi:hypothetical protein
VRGNFSGKSSGVVEGLGLNSNRNGVAELIEKRQNDEHLMSAVVGITPTLAKRRVEEVCHQTIGLTCHGKLFFEYASALKFGETLQLVAGKSLQEIKDTMSIDRNCGPK